MDPVLSLEAFLDWKHLPVLRAYERLCTYKWEDIKIGDVFIMLRAGFNGDAYVYRKVLEIHNEGNHPHVILTREGQPKAGESQSRSILIKELARDGGHKHEFWTDIAYKLTPEDLEFRDRKGVSTYERAKYFKHKAGIDYGYALLF